MNNLTALAAILPVLLCAGCAAPIQIDERNSQQIANGFVNGTVELADSIVTTSSFEKYRPQMHTLYQQGNWKALSKVVIEVNFDVDLDWFYLGRSAEGLGLNDAARHYYARGLSTINTCTGPLIGDQCDGLRFPQDIMSRVNALAATAP